MPVRRHPIAVSRSDGLLSALPIDHELIGRLKAIYAQVRGSDIRLAEVFYARLFAVAPHLRSLFRGNMTDQAHKLTASLDAVVRSLENPTENAAMLAELGRRHADYGAKPEHYKLVGDLIIDSMRELLGPSGNEKGLAEWRMALMLISQQMIAAGATAAGQASQASVAPSQTGCCAERTRESGERETHRRRCNRPSDRNEEWPRF